MTDIYLPPNFEALTSFFLAGQGEIIDYVPASRIVTDLSGINMDWTDPAIRVTQFYDTAVTNQPLWSVRAQIQVEAFAGSGGKNEAFIVAALCRACMDTRMQGTHSRGIVTAVSTYGMQDAPDDSLSPAHPRWLFTASITGHPLPAPIS